jgi:putative flavoprotein involved in K+ transport
MSHIVSTLAAESVAPTHVPVAVIGGGQAGLSMSFCLKQRGIRHVVFEKHRIAHEWRENRWDSFCLVTPNWQCQLPGFAYAGDDPRGFMLKDDIVRYIEAYAAAFQPPIRQGVTVVRLHRRDTDRYAISTSAGEYTADQVVVATGGYHRPLTPRLAERLPESVLQLHSSGYRSPQALPDGAVLVVGTGQSGSQIAEDLHLAGRRVHLCVGSAPRSPRLYRGKDVIEWLTATGYYDIPIDEHPQKETVREKTNHYFTGRDGGREIDLRRLALEGMHLYGRMKGLRGTRFEFHSDLEKNLDHADAVANSIRASIDKYIAERGIDAPSEPPYRPVWKPRESTLEVNYVTAGIRTVIWCIGFETDYRWVEVPVFDGRGAPAHHRGVTSSKGLYFLGLPWLHTWGSGRFSGVAQDAEYLGDRIKATARPDY